MTTFLIPLTPEAQTFSITLSQIVYQMKLQWNRFSQSWTLDILSEASAPIVSGIPLVNGVDLMGQYPYLNFGGQLILQTESGLPATYSDLGISSQLHYITP